MQTKKKTFDCVEIKHQAAQKVQKVVSGMTVIEELDYWRRGTDELLARQAERLSEVVPSSSLLDRNLVKL